ncbi:MAG: sugar porter family MFS transporter [Bacteroidetes bacterium]|nr:sugar porter family MFS transporter [Bacteroidota bacterium]
MKGKVFLIYSSIVAALGGFLFGFDTAVISGAEGYIQKLFQLNDWWHGFTVSIALYGTVIGAMFGGLPAEKFGRKKTLVAIGVLYLFSALGSALAPEWYSFMFFRFIGGLGVGASSVVGPMYISEIAPASKRGKLVGMFQFNIVLGILIAYFSNYLIGEAGENSWRWMLGVEAFPAILFVISLRFIPNSPRWLIKTGRTEEAREVLVKMEEPDIEKEIKEIEHSFSIVDTSQEKDTFFSKKYATPITLAVLFAMFNQLSGINAIIYYAPRIFEMSGLGKSASLLSSVGIGSVNLLATLTALFLIDKYGRKGLMYVGSVGVIIFLGLVGYSFLFESTSAVLVPFYLFGFIAFFAISQGAVIWVFISEIFPNRVRSKGQSLGSFTHWIFAAVIAQSFPGVAAKIGAGSIFIFFSIMMVLQFLFVWRIMPETKGKSLEEIQKEFDIS